MRFSHSFLLAIVNAPFVVFAQSNPNPFNVPTTGLDTSAGSSLTLNWKPTTQGTVTLVLRSGANSDLTTVSTIASSIPNSGSYTWSVPSSIVRGADYAVEIVDDGDTSETNYTPQFVIDSSNTVSSSVSGSASASSVTSGTPSSSSSAASATTSTSTLTTSTSSSASSTSGSSSMISSGSQSSSASTTSGSSSSANTASANSAGFQSTSAPASQAKNAAPKATAMVGMMGVVALGALAL